MMCFIQFSTEEDACLALGLKDMQVVYKSCGIQVQFIQPAQSLATHKTYRHALGLLGIPASEILHCFSQWG